MQDCHYSAAYKLMCSRGPRAQCPHRGASRGARTINFCAQLFASFNTMTEIDPADFVQTDEPSLQFKDPKQQAKLELGVCMAVYQWEELNLAVENSWGGANSSDKRDWISAIVVELFQEKVVDVGLIEETLLYAMVDEFDTHVENDSALVIGALILKMYRECMVQDYARIDDMYRRFEEKQKAGHFKKRVSMEEDLSNDEMDEDESDAAEPSVGTNQGIDAKQPVIDEDGFELVTKGRRR